MAMGKAVLASPAAMEGIEAGPSLDVRVAERAADWCESALEMLRGGGPPFESDRNRDFVAERYSWRNSLGRLATLLKTP
jgi:hypothetical protein